MTAVGEESIENALPDNPEDSSQTSWSVNQTRILISYFKENPMLWDKRLKDSGVNKPKGKKIMLPLIARFEKTQPPRSEKDIKSRWHSLRSSTLRNMKKLKEDPDYYWAFWEDLEFLRSALEISEASEDHCEWSLEEIGKKTKKFIPNSLH